MSPMKKILKTMAASGQHVARSMHLRRQRQPGDVSGGMAGGSTPGRSGKHEYEDPPPSPSEERSPPRSQA